MSYDVRYTEPQDSKCLSRWFESPGMLHWFPMSNQKEILEMTNVWLLFSRYRAALTLTVDNEPVAMGVLFLMPYKKVAHHCLCSLIVDPEKERHGYGTALLKNLIHLATNYFSLEELHIELFGESPLIPILKKHGFEQLLYQEDYVKEGNAYYPRYIFFIELKKGEKI